MLDYSDWRRKDVFDAIILLPPDKYTQSELAKRGGFEFDGLSIPRKTGWWGYSVKFDLSKGALADFY